MQKEYFSDYVKRVGDIEGVSNIFTYATVPVDFSTDNDISDSTLMLGYNEKDLASLMQRFCLEILLMIQN